MSSSESETFVPHHAEVESFKDRARRRLPAGTSAQAVQGAEKLPDVRHKVIRETWDPVSQKYVDYKPKAPKLPPSDDTLKYWFYIVTRSKGGEDGDDQPVVHVRLASQTLISFVRTVIGHKDSFQTQPLMDIRIFFQQLVGLREHIAKLREIALPSKTLSSAETLAAAIDRGFKRSKTINSTPEQDNAAAEVYLDQLRRQLEEFMPCVEEEYEPVEREVEMFTSHKQITFELLRYLFKKGDGVILNHQKSGEKIAITLHSSQTSNGVFTIRGTGLTWNGTKYTNVTHNRVVLIFQGTIKLAALPFRHVTEKDVEELTARGKMYTLHAGIRHVQNLGPYGPIGRAIVDIIGFEDSESGQTRERPTFQGWSLDDEPTDHRRDIPDGAAQPTVVPLDPAKLYLLPPTVVGYSLADKKWCEFSVATLAPVKFDDEAWDHLVLDEDIKLLIRSLVEVTRRGYSKDLMRDVITSKGGGLIAVLHGKPGTGKTLTAESVAEHLQRPLYVVSSEELTFEAATLERNLKNILHLAKVWDAVCLIDEADTFLEQRSMYDLKRNAVVSVALRILEYYSGVLFLTTNRIKTFDEAFLSRFSIGIKFPELDQEKRYIIWTKFLARAGVKVIQEPTGSSVSSGIAVTNVKELASKNFNGRNINNLVRTSQALAIASGEALSIRHLRIVVNTSEKFLRDFSTESE